MALIFDNYIAQSGNCHLWTGRTEKRTGRGLFFSEGKDVFAHRFVYQRHHGVIPRGHVVVQTCGNVLCCNPKHLKLETASKAVSRQMAEGKKRKSPDFWGRLASRGKTGCMEWTGGTNPRGYGRLRYHGKVWQAHRLAYTLTKGEIPDGMYVCHTCDNPSCCNPEHLFLGDQHANMADMKAKGRMWDRRGSSNGSSKLTPTKVRNIRKLRAMGVSRKEIAAKYGVTYPTIVNIETGKTWADTP